MADTYGIAELAHEFAITARTIRYYEDHGLIAPLRTGQRRIYSARDRVRLRLIMRGKRLGVERVLVRVIMRIRVHEARRHG